MPTPAASVIVVRQRGEGIEIFMVRRHRASAFMSNALVFPGGKVEPGETAEEAALRELFEEAGVLLVSEPHDAAKREEARRRLLAGEATFAVLMADLGLSPDLDALHAWSRWVTPSAEPKRFDASFFVAVLPPGQTPSFDRKETVEEMWLLPSEALALHDRGDARVPPPQLRTFWELQAYRDLPSLLTAARARTVQPILPRFGNTDDGSVALFLPWDPEYLTRGTGDSVTYEGGEGPSRFLIEGMTWRMV